MYVRTGSYSVLEDMFLQQVNNSQPKSTKSQIMIEQVSLECASSGEIQ